MFWAHVIFVYSVIAELRVVLVVISTEPLIFLKKITLYGTVSQTLNTASLNKYSHSGAYM